jgi:hypothetical protein
VERFQKVRCPILHIVPYSCLPSCSSAHYHLLSGLSPVIPNKVSTNKYCLGVALAYAIYSPTYSATSSYIRGTIRDDPRFLWAGAAIWLVCLILPHTHILVLSLTLLSSPLVRRTLKPAHSPDPSRPPPARHTYSRHPIRLRLLSRLMPKLFL